MQVHQGSERRRGTQEEQDRGIHIRLSFGENLDWLASKSLVGSNTSSMQCMLGANFCLDSPGALVPSYERRISHAVDYRPRKGDPTAYLALYRAGMLLEAL